MKSRSAGSMSPSVSGRATERRRRSRVGRAGAVSAASLALVLALPGAALAVPGDLDTTFGTGGKVLTNMGLVGEAHRVAVQTDGRIVAVGISDPNSDGGDFTLVRYNPDGSLDTTFGTGGKVTTDIGGGADTANAVAVQRDGRIVVVGTSENFDLGGCCWFTLVRYNANGSLDTSFGTGGKVVSDFGTGGADDGTAVAVQTDGRIVAAGATAGDFVVARYNTNGSADSGFGAGGWVTTQFGGYVAGSANQLAVQADGRIVAAGQAGNSAGNYDFALARYNTNGSLDTGFGTGGKVTTDFGVFDAARGVAVQSDGRIVAAGSRDSGSGPSTGFALARYNSNGSLDTGFGTGGKVTTYFSGGAALAYDVAVQTDGRIVAAGAGVSNNDFALARYNTNGSLDSGFGTGGKVTTDLGGTDGARGVALQSDGKIVAAGPGGPGYVDFALARYKA